MTGKLPSFSRKPLRRCLADYHNEVNGDMFKRWFYEKLSFDLRGEKYFHYNGQCIVSFDTVNSKSSIESHNRRYLKCLCDHKVPFNTDVLCSQLLSLAQMNKQPPDFIRG